MRPTAPNTRRGMAGRIGLPMTMSLRQPRTPLPSRPADAALGPPKNTQK